MSKLTTVKNLFASTWTGFKNLFKTKYQITIYRQSDSGSGAIYKSEYISRNITINKPNHLKFRDYETKNMVEIRSVIGLELKIVEID